MGSKILDIACSNFLLDISPQARETKEKNKQMGLHQTKKFLHSKGSHRQNKKTTNRLGEQGLISKMYKVLTKLNTKITNNPI